MQILFLIFPLFFSLFIIYVNNSTGKRGEIGKLLPHYYEEMGNGKWEICCGNEKKQKYIYIYLSCRFCFQNKMFIGFQFTKK